MNTQKKKIQQKIENTGKLLATGFRGQTELLQCQFQLHWLLTMNESVHEVYNFLRIDETAAEFLARTHVAPLHTGVPFIDRRMPVRPGTVIEVTGMTGSGKTELLLQVGT